MKGLLAGCGVHLARQGDVKAQRDQARQCDGSALPAALWARLQREWQQAQWLTEQIGRLEGEPASDPAYE
jgi:hypothetical protein